MTTLIAEETLASDAATLSVSSIPNTYSDLLVTAELRSAQAAADTSDLGVRVGNGTVDSGANYAFWTGDSPTSTSAVRNEFDWEQAIPAAQADADMFSSTRLWIMSYADSTRYRTVEGICGGTFNALADRVNMLLYGQWRNTADVIDIVQFFVTTGDDLLSGSVMRVYGIG